MAHSFTCAYNPILIGFPPADVNLRSWILSGKIDDQVHVRKMLHGLVYALLTVTRTTLETIESQSKKKGVTTDSEEGVIKRQARLAAEFREHMTKGQSFKSPNAYRENFYKKVIESANKVNFHDFPHSGEDNGLSSSSKKLRPLENRRLKNRRATTLFNTGRGCTKQEKNSQTL